MNYGNSDDFLNYKNLVVSSQENNAQDGMETTTTGTTEDLSNQGKAHNLKIGKPIREQDRFLPMAKVARLMKKILPVGVMQTKGARECVQECTSEFISFITSEASDICSRDNRKVMDGDDIICAMSSLGFDNYIEPMTLYLQKCREAKKAVKANKPKDLPDDTFSNDTNHPTVFKLESLDDSEMNYEESD